MRAPSEPKYFAVPDPDSGDMTYWYQDKYNRLASWPPKKSHYGPRAPKCPEGVDQYDHLPVLRQWVDEVRHPWWNKVKAEIARDPDAASARFAQFSSRCCVCGKTLTDAASKVYGIGPECRAGFPPAVLEEFARWMGKAHTEWLATRAAEPDAEPL